MADGVVIKIKGDTSQFEKSLSGIGKSTKSILGSMGGAIKGVMSSQLVTGALSAVTTGFNAAVAAGKSFEAQMSQVYALSGATAQEQALLAQTAKDYGASTKFSATQAGEALSYMALAGWNAQQSVDALGGVLNLAAASGMDLGQASDMVTDYLSAFGMECDKAGYMADVMAYAQSHSNTSAQQLGEAYHNCAATMHAAGQDIETTTAMFEALANQGIKGSEAGTQMSAVMRDLTSKMDKGKIMIGKTAVQVMDAQGNFRDLNDIMVDVGKATEGMGTAEASAALMTTFTARSVKAVQTILNEGMGNVNAYEDALRGSTGTATEQAEQMIDNLEGDITIFKSALEGLEITAYDSFSGIARGVVQEGTDILTALNEAGRTGGISGMADALIDQIPTLLPKLTQGIQKLLQGVGKKMPALIKNLIGQVPKVLASIGELVPSLADSLFEAATAAVEGLVARLPELVPTLLKGIGNSLLSIGSGIAEMVGGLFDGATRALKSMGIISKNANDIIEDELAKIDKDRVAEISTSLKTSDVTFDAEAYKEQLQTAIDLVKSTIAGVKGLTATEQAQITTDILKGSGAQAVKDALVAMNVPEADAKAAATAMEAAVNGVAAALKGLNLTEEQEGTIHKMVIDGKSPEDIKATLESYGVNPLVAGVIAASLRSAGGMISGAIDGLGLTPAQAQNVMEYAIAGHSADEIKTLLMSYGVDSATAGAKAQSISDSAEAITGAIDGLNLTPEQSGNIQAMALAGHSAEEIAATLESYGIEPGPAMAAALAIFTAGKSISYAVNGIGLTDAQKGAVTAMVLGGHSAAEIAETLKSYGLDDVNATQIAKDLKTSVDGLSSVINNLGLTEEQKEDVQALVLGGASPEQISEALQKYGVAAGDADAAAAALTSGMEVLNGALAGLKIDDTTRQTLVSNAFSDRGQIKAALMLLGVPEETQKQILDSYETFKGSLAGVLTGIANECLVALTNGKASDDPEAIAKMQAAVDEAISDAKQKVEDYRDKKLKELELSGMTGTALEEAAAKVNEQCDAINADLDATAEAAKSTVDGLAGKSADEVRAAFKQIDEVIEYAMSFETKLAELNAALNPKETANMNAVKKGLILDKNRQAQAIQTAANLRDRDIIQAQSEYDPVIDALNQKLGETTDPAEIDAIEAEIKAKEAELQARVEQIIETYDNNMSQIVDGILKAGSGESYDRITGINEQLGIVDMMKNLEDSISTALSESRQGKEKADPDTILKNAGLGEADIVAIADKAGISVETLKERIAQSMNTGSLEKLGFDSETLRTDLNEQLMEAMDGIDVTGAGEVLTAALQNGLLADTEAMDWTNIEKVLEGAKDAIGKPLGDDVAAGVGEGQAEHDFSGEAATLATNDESALRGAFASQSPAQKMVPLGNDVAAGVGLGMQQYDFSTDAETVAGNSDAALAAALSSNNAASSAGETMAGKIVDAMDIESAMKSAGENAGKGFYDGLSSKQDSIVSLARSIASAVAQAIRDAMKIQSPSRVTRELGEFTGEGYRLGLEQSLSKAVTAARNIVGELNLRPKMDFSGITGAFDTSLQAAAEAEASRRASIYLSGREVSAVLADFNSGAINGYNSRVRMGYGRG